MTKKTAPEPHRGLAAPKPTQGRVPTEPGFQKRLGDMYKKVLRTPPKHVPDKRTKAKQAK